MNFMVEVKTNDLGPMVDEAVDFAVMAASHQILKDCNRYCKQDNSALIESSFIHSDFKSGRLTWATPYAVYQYEYPGTRLDKNPFACPGWCERAFENYSDMWQKTFANALRRGVGT